MEKLNIPVTEKCEETIKRAQLSRIDLYFLLWAPSILVTSVVVLPAKGATLGYIFALLSPIVVLFFAKKRNNYITLMVICVFFYLFLTLLSQLGNAFSYITFEYIILIDPTDTRLHFRKTLFTQSLYLLAGFLTFLYIKNFYNEELWDKYLFIGAGLLAFYGLYEILYFLSFGENGDFLSNRRLGHGEYIQSSSSFQTLNVGGISILRLKSLTGEPSMYSFSVLPFCIYALHTEKYKIAYLLFATLLLSTSTTAMLGILLYLIFFPIFAKVTKKWLYGMIILVIVVLVLMFIFQAEVQTIFHTQVVEKLTLQSYSGIARFATFVDHMTYYAQLNMWNQLVGLGFGTVRSTDLLSTLLVNIGIVGFFIFTIVFFYPILVLRNNLRNNGIKLSLIVIYVTAMISVPEFSYLSVWIFLGLAYHQLAYERKTRSKREYIY